MSEHAKPLAPGEIRTHTVGDQTFKIMHTGGGAFTQATVRTAGVVTTEVLATERFESAALKIYATAIERAEAGAAPVVEQRSDHVLDSVRTLTAGAVNLRPTDSTALETQRLGRALRAPAPTLASDVAVLRKRLADAKPISQGEAADMLVILDRIAGAVPQRATDVDGWPLYRHTCGETRGWYGDKPTDGLLFCETCWDSFNIDRAWQPLYTLGGE